MTPDELHVALQAEKARQLRDIQLRNRAKDVGATTSLTDLGLARRKKSSKHNTRFDGPSMTTMRQYTTEEPQAADTTQQGQGEDDSILFRGGRAAQQGVFYSAAAEAGQPKISRWADKSELKPIVAEMDVDSNAWGSSPPSDASQATDDSVQALHFGKLFRNSTPMLQEAGLMGYDGKLQPPPIDWNDRPRFNNNNPEFKEAFSQWTTDVCELAGGYGDGASFRIIQRGRLQNLDLHPDGIDLVPRDWTIDHKTAFFYGYTDVENATKYVQATPLAEYDDWGKLDMSRPDNLHIKDETTEDLVKTWLVNVEERRRIQDARLENKLKSQEQKQVFRSELHTNVPSLNIYVRPAIRADVPQLTAMYNWYIEHTCRPSEMHPVTEKEMQERLALVKSDKLPFIVAVMRNNKSMLKFPKDATESKMWHDATSSADNIDPPATIMKGGEKIVGWAAGQSFTAPDYLERISAELEVYVDSQSRQMGVARCLMDQALEVLDRGYIKRGGYDFHCPQELRHLYATGGGRDVHKILLVIRKYKHPKDLTGRPVRTDRVAANKAKDEIKVNDREDDYDRWMKKWLETWGFQFEACLSGIGAKNGRFIDTVYMTRQTGWCPREGYIPDPLANNS